MGGRWRVAGPQSRCCVLCVALVVAFNSASFMATAATTTIPSHPRKAAATHDHLIAGLVAGFASTVVFYPLELIKTRMQVDESRNGAYRTILGSFQRVVKQEGVAGLYKGLTPAVLASCGSWGGYFYLYEMAKRRKLSELQVQAASRTSAAAAAAGGGAAVLNSVDHLMAGFEAGIILALLFQPLWLAKTRMALQVQQGSPAVTAVPSSSSSGAAGPSSPTAAAFPAAATTRPYAGMVDTLLTIAREEGVIGLYKGVVPALLLTSHGAVQFAAYEWLKQFFQGIRNNAGTGSATDRILQPAVVSMVTGAAAKILASTVTYPYQVIRSRLQQRDSGVGTAAATSSAAGAAGAGGGGTGPKYTGTLDCALKFWRNEGVGGFFKGVVPNVIKVCVAMPGRMEARSHPCPRRHPPRGCHFVHRSRPLPPSPLWCTRSACDSSPSEETNRGSVVPNGIWYLSY